MRSLSVFGGNPVLPVAPTDPVVMIDGFAIRPQIMRTAPPVFDPTTAQNARRVLLQVTAFSCNYRDKGFMISMQLAPRNRFLAVGSEFVATVREVGAEVRTLKPGDRVVGQNHYTGQLPDPSGVQGGVPTNQASRELLVLHEDKLARIPDALPDDVAAAFSLGAQTAYSMIRKVELRPGDHVLVTSGTSNTSHFVLGALRHRGVHLYTTTASTEQDDRLRAMGAQRVIRVNGPRSSFRTNEEVMSLALDIGGFHAVIDPFYDLHAERAVDVLRPFGRYVTCGLSAQNSGAARHAEVKRMSAEEILLKAMINNLSLIGNCVGLREDLDAAIEDYGAGRFSFPIDSVFTGEDAIGFLHRTYCDRERWGKVVFRYAPA